MMQDDSLHLWLHAGTELPKYPIFWQQTSNTEQKIRLPNNCQYPDICEHFGPMAFSK
jgi:hypothetical protein